MNNIISVLLTVLLIAIVVRCIVKKVNSVFTFLTSGLVVLLIASIVTGNSILGDKTVGNAVLDVFVFVKDTFTKNASGIGMTLMMVTGYAMYMAHMGASTKLAFLATKPLSKIKSPYIVLSLLFVVGTLLKLVITSHSGLGMLLMATTFPILVSLGVSKLSAATVMVLPGFLDWGPNDSSAIFAGETVAGMPMMEYFLTYQGKVAVILVVVMAIFLPIYFSRLDKKNASKNSSSNVKDVKVEDANCPVFYSLLPLIPLVLVTVCSFIDSIKMDVVTANIIGFAIAFFLEMIRRKDRKAVAEDIAVALKAMGTCFANIVSILIGAAVFAEAIKLLGGITVVSNLLASVSNSPIIAMTLMSLITFGGAALLGSGNASWYAFGPLVPDVAAQMGVSAATIAVPMQLSTGIGRCVSPVAGVIIAVAGMADVDYMDIVKVSVVPMVLAFIINIIASFVIVAM